MRPLWNKAGTRLPNGALVRGRATNPARAEIDLREEYDRIVFGDAYHIPHGSPLVLRRLRRLANGDPVECVCRQETVVDEPSPTCPYCDNEGYLWDEEWTIGYSEFGGSEGGLMRRQVYYRPGAISADYKIFYLRYNTNILHGDKIIEPLLDQEGKPVVPYIRSVIYKPQTIDILRSDYGRIEFFTVYCREEDAIRSDTLK